LNAGSARSGIAVVGVGIARGDHQRSEPDHLGQPVANALGRPWVLDAARQPIGHTELALDLGQHQHPGVRGQTAAVKGNKQRLAADR
jgi:hypothetical protein